MSFRSGRPTGCRLSVSRENSTTRELISSRLVIQNKFFYHFNKKMQDSLLLFLVHESLLRKVWSTYHKDTSMICIVKNDRLLEEPKINVLAYKECLSVHPPTRAPQLSFFSIKLFFFVYRAYQINSFFLILTEHLV